jgi:transcriptional regulator with XRE-family HTH domain
VSSEGRASPVFKRLKNAQLHREKSQSTRPPAHRGEGVAHDAAPPPPAATPALRTAIKSMLRSKKMTQESLALKMGVRHQPLSHWMCGRSVGWAPAAQVLQWFEANGGTSTVTEPQTTVVEGFNPSFLATFSIEDQAAKVFGIGDVVYGARYRNRILHSRILLDCSRVWCTLSYCCHHTLCLSQR